MKHALKEIAYTIGAIAIIPLGFAAVILLVALTTS